MWHSLFIEWHSLSIKHFTLHSYILQFYFIIWALLVNSVYFFCPLVISIFRMPTLLLKLSILQVSRLTSPSWIFWNVFFKWACAQILLLLNFLILCFATYHIRGQSISPLNCNDNVIQLSNSQFEWLLAFFKLVHIYNIQFSHPFSLILKFFSQLKIVLNCVQNNQQFVP